MTLVYTGKTKNVYALDSGHYLLRFKDDVTGEDGRFDPGANTVGLTLEGAGRAGLEMSSKFFQILDRHEIPSHYVDADVHEATMTVRPAHTFGQGLEVICRYRAVGSFLRRYGPYVDEGQPLDALVEFTLKDDERGDPPITEEALAMLGIASLDQAREIRRLTRRICGIIRDELADLGIELYDIKLEFGTDGRDGAIMLIDEISGGNMRAYADGVCLEPLELARRVLAD
jgi:phosphoribosylaminoimidazole-succinocarboxamide synthase